MTSTAALVSESADAPDPTSSTGVPRLRRYRADIVGVVVVCLVMLVGYFQVPFAGKTFSTASYVVGYGGACGTATGVCNANRRNDPRPDGGASAWQLEPWAQVTHRTLDSGELPLWNPYQGIGTPLAADPPTAALDPLMLAVFVHPTMLVTDLSIMLWLLLVGVAAYAAARALRLSPLVATMVGVVYGLSGWFFAYSNNYFFRVYLFFPLIIATAEWTIRSKRRLPPALLGVSLAWIVLVGMPEPMFMAMAGGGLFAGARLITGEREGTRRQTALRLAGGAALGLALAAPIVLAYREYLSLSFNIHPFTGAPLGTDSVHQLVDWLMPRITRAPAKALFDDREWIGAGAALLAVVAVCHPRSMRRYAGWPLVLVTAVMGLQIYGGRHVAWTGRIPLWAQVGWTRFATPVPALTVALLAGIGLQTLIDGAMNLRRAIAASVALVALVAVLLLRDNRPLDLWSHVAFRGGWPLAVLTVAVIVAAVLLLDRHLAARAIASVVILELLLLAPYGIYANRDNPYPSRPWITYLQANTRDQSRVFSTQAFLYPDVASAYGLSDPRTLDALFPKRYWEYLGMFISHRLVDRFTAVDPNEPVPNWASNPMFDLLGIRYLVFHDGPDSRPPDAKEQFRRVYRADGVKILENLHAAPRAFVVHDLKAVPDMAAALQFFTTTNPAHFPDGSVRVQHFDPRSRAVIEADPKVARPQSCAKDAPSSTRIVSYSATKVKIAVTNSCPGLMVLSDEYFPGWSATVNGHHAAVYPTDVALRGVPVPAGSSTVVLRYRPAPFRKGLILFAIGLVALAVLAVTGLQSSRWWRGRRRSAAIADE
jgi:hypothetical protein